MRKLISLPQRFDSHSLFQNLACGLTCKPVYYARSSKNRQNKNEETQKSQKFTIKDEKNSEPNKDDFKAEQPQSQGHITRPKRLLQLFKKGNLHIIPFYVKHYLKNTKNIALPFRNSEEIDLKEQNSEVNYGETQIREKKKEQKNEQKSQGVKQQKQARHFNYYPFKSSAIYRQILVKKYRILQSVKATKNISSTLFSIPSTLFSFDLKLNSKKIGLDRILRVKQNRSFIYRAAFYTFFLATVLIYTIIHAQKILPYPNWYIEKADQLSDSEIQAKLNQIKEIRVGSNSRHTNQMTIVLKEQRQLNPLEQIISLFGFEVNKNKSLTFDAQNPNLILDGLQKTQQHRQHQSWVKIKPITKQYSYFNAFFDTLFLSTPFIGMAITYWIFRKINPDSVIKGMTSNKKNMKIQSTKDIKVRFKDVAGMDAAKKQITQFVDFLKKGDKYVQMGAKIPKGALLTGPPGTGKTMLAKACAGQAGTSFFYVSGSEFVEMFVGLGAARVRQLFARARQQAPSIIFIDQIDAIGKKRQSSRNQEKDSTLNQMLVQMDGFSSSQTVIVLAATNRKDILDSALTRPGRFDRMVQVTLPQLKARQQIFMVHLAPLKINPERPLSQIAKRLAELTPGFSGADIANLCNEAAIIATRKKRTYIQDADFEEASERIMAGYVKKGLSNQKTRKRVAYHEAGHAVCGWYLRGGDPLVKLTIIPRSKGALGYAQYLPKTAYIKSKNDLIDQIAIMLGGTTSEQTFLGNMSSGNSDDLQKVYSLTRRMITQFGMGQKTYNMTIDEQTYVKKQSQKLCDTMDQQILQIVNEASNRAKSIIQEKRNIVQQLAQQLLAKQTINSEDILRIMGARPAFI